MHACMLACVSLAARLLAERLASGALGCLGDGDAPRVLLSWLLLGADGPALRRRRHEFLWIAALPGLVSLEKLAPKGELVARALGGAMIGAGVAKWAWTSLP